MLNKFLGGLAFGAGFAVAFAARSCRARQTQPSTTSTSSCATTSSRDDTLNGKLSMTAEGVVFVQPNAY